MSILKQSLMLFTGCLFTLFFTGLQATSVSKTDTQTLHSLFDAYFEYSLNEYPEMATILGYPGLDHLWTDMAEESIAERGKTVAAFFEKLNQVDREVLDDAEQLNYDAFKNVLEDAIRWNRFNREYLPINKLDGIHLTIGMILDAMPTNTEADFGHILARLRQVPKLIEQNIALLKKGLAKGIVASKVSVAIVPQQIDRLVTQNLRDCYYFAPFLKIPESFADEVKEKILRDAEHSIARIYPALAKLRHFLVEEYIPLCRETVAISELPDGQEWYLQCIQSHTTTNLTPEAIHQIGKEEVARIRGEMYKILEEVKFEGSLEEFFDFINMDERFFYTKRKDLLRGYQNILKKIERALPNLFGKLPSIPYQVIPVPKSSEEQAVAAYYLEGSLKANRSGRFYVNTSKLETRPKWEMEALALHEALPGHHMQISIALENENLPAFRSISYFTAYIEGWGLYSEGLGKELGLYEDPYSRFGRLNMEIFRAIRLVVDTGLHALGWSRQEAIDYFKANSGMGRHEIRTEIDRYITWPGQALAYKIGERKILEMRRLAEEVLGDSFDIRAFHDEVLESGALPLTVFEEKMKRWISHIKPPFVNEPVPACYYP